MSVEATSEAACGDSGWGDYVDIDEKENTTAELGGRKRELTVLREKSKFLHALGLKEQTNLALHHKAIVRKSSTSTLLRPMEAGGSVKLEVTVAWGGEGGTAWSGGASAEVYDNNSNYAKIEVKQDSDGNGNATVSAGHTEEKK